MNEKGGMKYLSGILKEVGTPGFMLIFIVFVFLTWGSLEQKQEFIDSYILLKSSTEAPCVLVVVFLLATLVISAIYFRRLLHLEKAEVARLSIEKSKWEKRALKH